MFRSPLRGLAGRILKHLEAYLAACQLGITMTSLGLGWVDEPAVAAILEPLFRMAGLSEAVLHDAAGQYEEIDTNNATVAIWAAARGIAALALAPAAAGDDAQAQAVKQAVRGLEFLMGPRRPGGEAGARRDA